MLTVLDVTLRIISYDDVTVRLPYQEERMVIILESLPPSIQTTESHRSLLNDVSEAILSMESLLPSV